MAKQRIAIVYNQPTPSRYDAAGEEKAAAGVLESVGAVERSLSELGFDASLVALVPPVESALADLDSLEADLVFNLFEGFCGEPASEPLVPEALAKRGIPYTGCPADALRLALDKAKTKQKLRRRGIPTPASQLLTPDTLRRFRLSYPCIVKPPHEDASHGLSPESVVHDKLSLAKQVIKVTTLYDSQALVEEFLDGREFNVTCLGKGTVTALPISEIVYTLPEGLPRLLTFAAKWEPDDPYYHNTKVVCPADIPRALQEEIESAALWAFCEVGCRGYARVDLRLDKEGRANVIEVNPNPDISPEAGAARQAKAAGMTYTQFIARIVELARATNKP